MILATLTANQKGKKTMATRDENSKSDSDRLQELEATTATHKNTFLVLGLAVITTVVAITLGVVRMISPPSSFAHVNELVQIQTQVKRNASLGKRNAGKKIRPCSLNWTAAKPPYLRP